MSNPHGYMIRYFERRFYPFLALRVALQLKVFTRGKKHGYMMQPGSMIYWFLSGKAEIQGL